MSCQSLNKARGRAFRRLPGLLLGVWLATAAVASAQPVPAASAAAADSSGLFFDEKLGEILPGDIVLRDEGGQAKTLAEWIDKPTLLTMVYFDCPGLCTPLLNEVADILGKTDLDPKVTPFQLLTVSFEPRDTPATAAEKRMNYLKLLNRPFPPENWRFLTGDAEDLKRLTAGVGFRYKKVGFEYIHPGGLVILTPERKVSRYLYGTEFLPFDFKMGVIEAARGEVKPTTARFLEFCFSYDPQGRTYVFNIMRVVGSTMLLTLALFGGFLVYTTRKHRRKTGRSD